MDLPTYTNIWRIEKRLYKLYDFRLPAPLPITWIAYPLYLYLREWPAAALPGCSIDPGRDMLCIHTSPPPWLQWP